MLKHSIKVLDNFLPLCTITASYGLIFISFRKFIEMQQSILITCYNAGMIGIGQKYTSLAGLTPQQVKVHA